MEKDTLFLHGGPGFNAHVERQVLGDRCPNTYFWDQPAVHTRRRAFDTLMDATVAEVERMCAARGGPVKLMANSFAGHLVSGLLERIPHRISACHLIGAVHDIPAAFRNLLDIMAKSADGDVDLVMRIASFLRGAATHGADKEHVWDYYELIASDADFMRHYWPSRKQYRAWMACLGSGPMFDFTTFRNVMSDFLLHHYERRFSFAGSQEVVIELGDRDPLLDMARETRLWLRSFPAASMVIRRKAGHFIHLEPYI